MKKLPNTSLIENVGRVQTVQRAVVYDLTAQVAPEAGEARASRPMNQVSMASAVRGAETGDGAGRTLQDGKTADPCTFTFDGIGGGPDVHGP